MKNLWILFLFAGLLMACQSNTKKTESTDKSKTEQVVEVQDMELTVKGMTCTGCEKSVENGLKEVDGVIEVKASHKDNKVVLKMDKSKMNKEEITQKIEAIGYMVSEE